MEEHPYDEPDMQEGMEAAMLQNWRNVLAVYAVKVSTDEEHGLDVMTMDEEKPSSCGKFFSMPTSWCTS